MRFTTAGSMHQMSVANDNVRLTSGGAGGEIVTDSYDRDLQSMYDFFKYTILKSSLV